MVLNHDNHWIMAIDDDDNDHDDKCVDNDNR